MSPEEVDIDVATPVLIGDEILPSKMSTWIHLFEDHFCSIGLWASNKQHLKKLKLYLGLKKTFELGVKFKLVKCPWWLIRRRFRSANCAAREFLKLFLYLLWSLSKEGTWKIFVCVIPRYINAITILNDIIINAALPWFFLNSTTLLLEI